MYILYLQFHNPCIHPHISQTSFSAPWKAAALEKRRVESKNIWEAECIYKKLWAYETWKFNKVYLRTAGIMLPIGLIRGLRSHARYPCCCSSLPLLPHFVENVSITICWWWVVLIPVAKFWNSRTFVRLPHQIPDHTLVRNNLEKQSWFFYGKETKAKKISKQLLRAMRWKWNYSPGVQRCIISDFNKKQRLWKKFNWNKCSLVWW